jgi:tetratricopeptide (TPR) repeat protein
MDNQEQTVAKMKRQLVLLSLIVLSLLVITGPGTTLATEIIQGASGYTEDIYTIQIGAFKNLDNASLNYDKIKSMPGARVEKIGRYYVVRLGKFKDPGEAGNLMKSTKPLFKTAFLRKTSYEAERVVLSNKDAVLEVGERVITQTPKVEKEITHSLVATEPIKEEISQSVSGGPLVIDEKKPPTTEEQGLAAEMAGQWDKAVDIYKSALLLEPGRTDLWLRIADIEARLGNKEEVIGALKKATELSPRDAELHFKLSQARSVAQQPKEALEEVSIALGINPGDAKYLAAQAELEGWLGQYGSAINSLKKLIEIYPQDDSYRFRLAQLQVWNGQLDQSVRNYRTYLAKHPDNLKALLDLAKAEVWRGNFSAAEKVLNQYRKQAGETKDYWNETARLQAAARRPRAALRVIDEKLRSEPPDDYEVQKSKVVALRYLNSHYDALKGLDVLELLRPLSRETSETRRFVKTQLRDFVEGGFQFYHDSDHLSRYNSRLHGGYFIDTRTTMLAGIEYDWLNARAGSGLENIDGKERAEHERLWAGVNHRLSPSLALEVELGIARAESSDMVTHHIMADLQPGDGLSIKLTRDYGYYLISPRTVSIGIRQGYNGIEASWSPDFVYTVDAVLSYATFSDDNARWEAILGPRMAVLRSGKINIDIGILGLWDGFDKTLNHGYYDPEMYQLYAVRGFSYWKLSDDDGVSAMALVGLQKDNTMNGFRSAISLDLEGTFGIYRDWMLKTRGGLTNNLREATATYRAIIASIALTRRF